jgi:TIR domain
MSTFQFGGFVSYRHGDPNDPDDALNSFAKQVRDALSSELRTQGKKIFFDEAHMKGGYILNATLGQSICQSVCMIVIFVRDYLSHHNPYCAAELMTMLACEKERFSKLGIDPDKAQKGHIITLAYRNPDLVPDILKERVFYDFSDHTTADLPLRLNKNHADKFVEISSYIADLYEEMEDHQADLCADCQDKMIPKQSDQAEFQPILDFIMQHRKKRPPLKAQF